MKLYFPIFLAAFELACSSTVSIRDYGNDEDSGGKPDSEPVGVPPDGGCCQDEADGTTPKPLAEDDSGTSEDSKTRCCEDSGGADTKPIEKETGVDSEVEADSGLTDSTDSPESGEVTVDSGPDSKNEPDSHSEPDAVPDAVPTIDSGSDTHDAGSGDSGADSDSDALADSTPDTGLVGDPCPTESAYTCTGDQTYVCTSGAWVAYGGKCNFGCHVASAGDAGDAGDGGDAGGDPEAGRCNCESQQWVKSLDNWMAAIFDPTTGLTWAIRVTDGTYTAAYQNGLCQFPLGLPAEYHYPTVDQLKTLFSQEGAHETSYCPANKGQNLILSPDIWPENTDRPLALIRTPSTGGAGGTHRYVDQMTGVVSEYPDFTAVPAVTYCVKE